MTLSHAYRTALISAASLFLLHCSSSGGSNDQGSGGTNTGNGGASANGGSGTGGSGTGGSGTGGSGTGGSGMGSSGTGGSTNGGANSGGASSGGNASGGISSGGSSSGGASTGGSSNAGGNAGSTAKGGGSATGGTSATGGSSSGGGTAKGGSAGQGNGGQGGGSSSGFTLSSSKLAPNMAFPTDFTCAGADKSPPFTWSNPPSGTMSFAMVLTDMSITFNHWVIWDIPGSTMMLPEALASGATLTNPDGAKQKQAFGSTVAYVGPCPSGQQHTYVFTLYAIDVATLPNVTTSTSFANIVTAIQAHDLASATLSGTSDARRP